MIEIINEYLNKNPFSNKYVGIIDLVLAFLVFVCLGFLLLKKTNRKYPVFVLVIGYIFLLVTTVFGLELAKYAIVIAIIVATFLSSAKVKKVDRNVVQESHVQSTGQRPKLNQNDVNNVIDVICDTCEHLAKRHTGAIITIEKEDISSNFQQQGTYIDAEVSVELLETIFFPNTALHDGAVVIRGNRIVRAAVCYPLSRNANIPSKYGTRHMAAIGISELTDSYTVVVSEQRGEISVATNGTLTTVSVEQLRNNLQEVLKIDSEEN